MKNKLFSVILICAIAAVMTLAACAEESYTFTLSDGETFKEENEYWYADLTAAHISGMADEKAEADLNNLFRQIFEEVKKEYTDDVEYMQENYGNDEFKPRFGYELSYNTVTDNDDYFVFNVVIYSAAGSSMTMTHYWTLDKHTGDLVRLSDFMDADALAAVPDEIYAAMEEINQTDDIYWVDDVDITTELLDYMHHWYINADNDLVATFDKYEVAPGAQGESRFEIKDGKASLIKSDTYAFDLYVGESFEEITDNWSADLKLPVVGSMADADEQQTLNQHFKDTYDGVKKDYDEAVEFGEKSVAEGADPHFSYSYGYEILTYSDDVLAFKTSDIYVSASLNENAEYWNLDTHTGRLIRFEDVVSEADLPKIREQIFTEMSKMNDAGEGSFTLEDDSLDKALASVGEKNHWYLMDDGSLVIAFDKYEVAAGFQGNPSFTVELGK